MLVARDATPDIRSTARLVAGRPVTESASRGGHRPYLAALMNVTVTDQFPLVVAWLSCNAGR
jgi:hypothetical protein